jgi:putative flippase GtrA
VINGLSLADLRTRALLLARYAIAGGLTSMVYIAVYNGALFGYAKAFEGQTLTSLVRFLCSNVAYGCALLFQYSAHGRFTFGHRQTRAGQLLRYLIAVGFGFLMAACISAANGKLYMLPDVVVSIIVMVLVAISNFVWFTFWVYAHHDVETEEGAEKPASAPLDRP